MRSPGVAVVRKALRAASLLCVFALLSACEPTVKGPVVPGDSVRAQGVKAALAQRSVPADVADKLLARQALSEDEVRVLRSIAQADVLALLAINPSASQALLASMAKHPDDGVRMGVAANPNTPVDVLMALHAMGKLDPINRALAMNPSTPLALLRSMREQGEVGDASLAANPMLPPELMHDIARRGDALALEALRRNPALPADLHKLLHPPR